MYSAVRPLEDLGARVSWEAIKAVYNSRIEPPYRFLAVALASFSPHKELDGEFVEVGENIHPSVKTLAHALGVGERAVWDGLQALIESGVIVPVDFVRHTRRYRFDLD